MKLDDLLREMLRDELEPLRRRIAELEAANEAPSQPLAFTVAEVSAKFLPGVPESTLREWIREGELTAHMTPGGRVYLVYLDDLRAFLQQLKSKKPEEDDRRELVSKNVARIVSKNRAS